MANLTVLGIGNILMRDEGVGVRLLEAVKSSRDWPAEVEFVDGGAAGLGLLGVLESAHRLVVLDAAEMGLPPGQARVIRPEQLADDPTGRISLHEMPFIETLKLAERFTRRPEQVTILAVQPKDVAYGRDLSEDLQAAFDGLLLRAAELVAQELAAASAEEEGSQCTNTD